MKSAFFSFQGEKQYLSHFSIQFERNCIETNLKIETVYCVAIFGGNGAGNSLCKL